MPDTTAAANEAHPIADMFPLMPADELDRLAEDIRENGLREPILLHPDGSILDGRNRARACQAAGVEPRYQTWDGEGSLVRLVLSLNLHRRHLTSSQRAMLAVDVERELAAEAKERQRAAGAGCAGRRGGDQRSEPDKAQQPAGGMVEQRIAQPVQRAAQARDEAAEAVGSNRQYVQDAKTLTAEAPDLAAQVVAGEATIPQAKRELRKRRHAAEQDAAREAAAAEPAPRTWAIVEDQQPVRCAALITDPPYGILAEPWEPAELEAFTRAWLARWSGCGAHTVLCFWSQRWLYEGRRWFDEELRDYEYQQTLAWVYRNNKSPQSRRGFKQTWEPIFYYRRRGSDRVVKPNAAGWGDDAHDLDTHVAAVPQSNFNGADMKRHPAQKPVSVMRWLIAATTQPGELVCDPFVGSGTTGIAATQLGRQFHGIDASAEYRGLAEGRIAAYA